MNKKYTINSVDSNDLTVCDLTETSYSNTLSQKTNLLICVYEFYIGEIKGVVCFHKNNNSSFAMFDALNNFVNSLEDAETNFNVHTFFRFIMAATLHHQRETEIQSLTYRTKSAQKHRIYQLMSTRIGIPAVNEWESEMTEGGVD
jgi:hypothetical protein